MVPDTSPLTQLANCIVFSSKGSRDLPSQESNFRRPRSRRKPPDLKSLISFEQLLTCTIQLSGGDLDGDRYYIIWDEECRPKRYFGAADYPRQEPIDIGRAVNRDDMTDFFIQFMETDQLGRIAVLHRVLADQKPEGTLNTQCITLAEMHSTAVDFSKTGIPVRSETPLFTIFKDG